MAEISDSIQKIAYSSARYAAHDLTVQRMDGGDALTFDRKIEIVRRHVTNAITMAQAAKDAEIAGLRKNYDDLISQVVSKYRGETRHDTARRYIQQAEQQPFGEARTALEGDE